MDWFADSIMNPVVGWLARTVIEALDVLWQLLSATAFTSPDVTALPQVNTMARTGLTVVNTCYVLAFLWAAILVTARDTVQSHLGPAELIPRLVIGLITANFALPICSATIQLANALTAALTGQDITAPGSLRQLRAMTATAISGPSPIGPAGVLLLVIGLLIAVLVGTLIAQWIMRVGLLIVTVGVAPLALALHATPHTEAAAKLWWRTLFGTLATVVLQAVTLHTTLVVFLSPQASLPALGLPGDPGAVLNLLIVACLLAGVVRIPALMRRFVVQSRPSTAATFVRVLLVQRVTRALRAGTPAARTRPRPGRSGRRPGGWPVQP
jgi:hypothetical protein